MSEHWTAPAAMVPGSDDEREWWALGMAGDPGAQFGARHVEIVETVDTKSTGRVTIYRRWFVDPDGQPFGSKGLRVAQHKSVMRHLRLHGMALVAAGGGHQ
jgi:hypothetical protein